MEKTLILGKIKSKWIRGQQRMRWLDNLTNAMEMNFRKLRKIVEDRRFCCAVVQIVTESDVT